MAKVVSLKATARTRSSKGAARAVRREGLVPGVIYGGKAEPQLVSFAYNELWKHVETGRFLSTLVDLEIGGDKVRTIPRDVQFDPVRDHVVHVDFLRLGAGQRISVEVPVHFSNHEASPGLKRGGVLNIVRHEIDLYCPADSIPDQIEIDLTGLEIGHSIHISAIKLPEGVKPAVAERDFTIATIAGTVAEEVEPAAAAAAEAPAAGAKPGAAPAAAAGAKGAAAPAAAAGGKGAAAPAAAAKPAGGDKKK
ncbi:MAG: 50S ribosomal protein L25/general stress protein Ctc [Hyphomicrobiales bacterium]